MRRCAPRLRPRTRARSATYSFLVVEGDAAANFVQRSPLSAFPVDSAVPGVLGYFQVDAAGRFTTPLLPEAGVAAASYGIAPAEEAARTQRVTELRELLARNQLVRGPRDEPPAAPAPERESAQLERGVGNSAPASAQAGFDRLAAVESQRQLGAAFSRADAAGAPPAEPPAAAETVTVSPQRLEARRNSFADEQRVHPGRSAAEAGRRSAGSRTGRRAGRCSGGRCAQRHSRAVRPDVRERSGSVRARRARHRAPRSVPQRVAGRPTLRARGAHRPRGFRRRCGRECVWREQCCARRAPHAWLSKVAS